MSEQLDIDLLRRWIGRQDCDTDTITPELLKRFRATFGGDIDLASPIPLGMHWCLALPIIPREGLGVDGHPATGGFMPPVPLPRRMWASSRIRFYGTPDVGSVIERTSTITDVRLKQSKASGPLLFVLVDHEYAKDNATLIQEQQTIVYRQPTVFKQADSPGSKQPPLYPAQSLSIVPDSTLLFRYSALTFNGHRIHYDYHYTSEQEGYPGLVVQGPLTATLLMNLAQTSTPERSLREFEFRAVAPAFVDQALHLALVDRAEYQGNTVTTLEARNPFGGLIMTASARFD